MDFITFIALEVKRLKRHYTIPPEADRNLRALFAGAAVVNGMGGIATIDQGATLFQVPFADVRDAIEVIKNGAMLLACDVDVAGVRCP
jgi:hypothetical protein